MFCGAQVHTCGANIEKRNTSKKFSFAVCSSKPGFNEYFLTVGTLKPLWIFIIHLFLSWQLRIYAQPLQISTTEYAANVTKIIFDYFEEYFDMEYSIEKLGKSANTFSQFLTVYHISWIIIIINYYL